MDVGRLGRRRSGWGRAGLVAGVVSALVAGLLAVVAAPAQATGQNPNLQWYGYYFGGQNMTQVSSHSNTVLYMPVGDGNPVGTLNGLYEARTKGLKVIVSLSDFPFYQEKKQLNSRGEWVSIPCSMSGKAYRRTWMFTMDQGSADDGSADPTHGFVPFARAVYQAGLQDSILGFYNLDEANGKCGLGAADFATVGGFVKSWFPGKLMTLLYSTAGNMLMPIPANHDWIGLDDYNDYSVQANVNSYSANFSSLASRVQAVGAKMFIVGEAFSYAPCPPTTTYQNYLIRQNNFLFNWAQNHAIVAAYLPFLWKPPSGTGLCGAQTMTTLLPTLKNIGNTIVASNPRVYLPAPVPAPPPPAPGTCGLLTAYQSLTPGQVLQSCDGRFGLVLQYDGNLVLYQVGLTALWAAPGIPGGSNTVAVMQGDGNFVVYNAAGAPVWSSGTHDPGGAFLAVQNDGNLVIYNSFWVPIWSTGTSAH